jgi:hypothetical protein
MKSFKLEKTSGNADVTQETLMWLVVLVVVILPLLGVVAYILG